jgi:hypothetical protein
VEEIEQELNEAINSGTDEWMLIVG